MNVSSLMTQPAITCHAQDSLNHAAHLMWTRDVGALVAINDRGLASGMITDRDICMAAYTTGRPLDELVVAEHMSHSLISCSGNDAVADAQDQMRRFRLRRLAVVDRDGKPVGVLSLTDIARRSLKEANRRPEEDLMWSPWEMTETLVAITRPPYDETVVPAA